MKHRIKILVYLQNFSCVHKTFDFKQKGRKYFLRKSVFHEEVQSLTYHLTFQSKHEILT